MHQRRHLIKTLLAAALLCAAPLVAAADNWPAKPITIVIPFAPGGTTDIVGREVGQKLSQELGQPVIIDNRPGAGGNVGAGVVAHSTADGYTLFLATIAHSMAPAIYKKLNYDFTRDFDPVAMAATTPNVLVVNPQLPVKSVKELIAYIKANPGKVNYGSAGSGSTEHFAAEQFRNMVGVDITHVPYKGGAPMMTDLIGGQIQMAIETSASSSQYVRSNRVRALAVTSPKPSPAFPGVPTMEQAGVPGYTFLTWFALMAPRGTPSAVEQKLSTALAKALQSPDLKKRFEDQGVTPGNMSTAELASFIKSETTKWGQLAKQAGITVD